MSIRAIVIAAAVLFPSSVCGQAAFFEKGTNAFSVTGYYSARQHAEHHFPAVNAFGSVINYATQGIVNSDPDISAAGIAVGIVLDGTVDVGGSLTGPIGSESNGTLSPSAYFTYYVVKQDAEALPFSAGVNISFASWEEYSVYSAGLLVSRNVRIKRSMFVQPTLGGAVTTSEFGAEDTGGHFMMAAPFYFALGSNLAIVISTSASYSKVEPVYSIGLGVVIEKSESSSDRW